MSNVMFMVGSVDMTDNVVAQDYNIASYPEYQLWTDANGREHRSKYRDRISGTLDLYFFSIDEYDAFLTTLALYRQSDQTYSITVYDNNAAAEETITAFIDYTPTRYRGADLADQIAQLRVTIREQ
jgi:hypothetical protein